MLAFGFFVCGFTMAFANTHFMAFADDMGMGTVEASDVIAVTAVFSIVGSVLLGMGADRYRRSRVLALTYFLRGLAFVLLAILPIGPMLNIYAVVLGMKAFALLRAQHATGDRLAEQFLAVDAGAFSGGADVLAGKPA